MFKKRGQSTVEYALIIATVVAGLLVMQHYIKRGFAGRLRSAADDMGEQFDPAAYTGNFDVKQSSEVRQSVQEKETKTEYLEDATSTKTGSDELDAYEEAEDLFSK